MPGKCTFTNKWITDPNYSQWISKDADPSKAKCVICYKSFDVSNMGEAALKSHMAGKKHKQNLAVVSESSNPGRINTISSYFSSQGSKSSSTLSSESVPSTSKGTSSATDRDMSSYLTPDSVLKAELIWTMKLIDSHNSYNSAKNISSIFGLMFPDSEIASRFTCGEDKSNYLATFGLAPYFTARMKDKIRGTDEYVLLFDESLNKSMQMKQLDIHARFFDSGIVTTRYIGSEFMGHATANDLHDRILPVIQDLGTSNLVQLSMDRPNVNWKLFELLCEDVSKEHKKSLLNIGSCGMHVMHNAFRSGCIGCGWEIEETLCSFHRLFKDSPARTEDFEKVTNSTTFPLKFCRHRWLENQSVMARALEVKPKLDQYVQSVERNQVPNPKTKTFETVRSAIKDPLFEAKGEFFLSIAREIEPFLADYQTVSPMISFIGTDIVKILKSLMRRFVKDDILAAASTPLRISKLELKDENLKDTSQVDIGFATKQAVTKAKKKVSERVIYQFRNDCRKFLLNVTKKLLEKSPIKYSLVRTAKWMDPEEILKDGASCETALTATLQVLVNSQYVNGRDCDRILSEYREMMAGEVVDLHSFKRKDMRLDKFYAGVRESKQLKNLWTIMKLLMCLSHGQADVERGFSVNKEVEVENQKERTLVARRIIVDHIRTAGGVMNVGITKEMLSHAKQARQRYRTFLEEEKKKRMDELKGEKRKLLEDEIDSKKKRKVQLEKDACFLHKEADSTAELAEKGGDLSLLAKSNAMRRRAREKDAEAQNAEQLIKIKEGELVD